MKTYKKRICDALLADELSGAGAVLIEGAKWCGKTTTAEQAAKSAIYIDEPGKFEEYDLLAHSKPERILDGESPRLIDEWQLTPALWDAIRYRVDHGDGSGRYILTGSSVPPETDEIKLGGKTLIEKGAATLNRLAGKIDLAKMKAPSFKMVLTAVGDYAYRRKEDGVIVCPISSLKD